MTFLLVSSICLESPGFLVKSNCFLHFPKISMCIFRSNLIKQTISISEQQFFITVILFSRTSLFTQFKSRRIWIYWFVDQWTLFLKSCDQIIRYNHTLLFTNISFDFILHDDFYFQRIFQKCYSIFSKNSFLKFLSLIFVSHAFQPIFGLALLTG